MFPINQVLQGDCTRVLRTLPNEVVDLVVTDPPYGVRYQDGFGRTIANDDNLSRVLGAFTELYRVLKPNSVCISFYGWSQVDAFFRAWRHAGFRPVGHIVWVKEYASRTHYLRYRHEQAYVLAKGRPALPAEPLDDIQPWTYSGNPDHPTQVRGNPDPIDRGIHSARTDRLRPLRGFREHVGRSSNDRTTVPRYRTRSAVLCGGAESSRVRRAPVLSIDHL